MKNKIAKCKVQVALQSKKVLQDHSKGPVHFAL